MDIKTLNFIHSESEFNRASFRGFWEIVRNKLTRHDPYLISFNQVIERLRLNSPVELGVQDIALKDIVGSVGRPKSFTRHFLPHITDKQGKERWRTIYTLAVSGTGFPPIEVYKMGHVYFVTDGHHRVSVAHEVGQKEIDAHVSEWEVACPILFRRPEMTKVC